MKIRQKLVSSNKHNIKCPYGMNAKFIIVHNTANDASANNEISYMINNNNEVSFHIAVDDKEAVQGIPFNRNSWNAGDGGNGNGNRNGIAIEICYSKSGGDRFIKAEKNATKLIAQLLKERGWGIDKVKKHQDFSNKYCPHRTLDMGWQRFLNMIKVELDALNESDTSPVKPTTPKPNATTTSLKVGDKVTVINPIDENGTHLSVNGIYDVFEVKGNRIVISRNGGIIAALPISHLKKVGATSSKPNNPTVLTKKHFVGEMVCTNTLASNKNGGNVYKGDWEAMIEKIFNGAKYPYRLKRNGVLIGFTNDTGIDTDPHIPKVK